MLSWLEQEEAPGLGLEGPPPGGPREGWWARQMAPKAGQAHTALPPWYCREPHSGCCVLNLLPSRRVERGCPSLLEKARAHPHTHTQELCGQGIHALCLLGSQGFPAVGTSGLREESGRLMKAGDLCAVPTPEPDSHWQRRGAPPPAPQAEIQILALFIWTSSKGGDFFLSRNGRGSFQRFA